VAAIADALRADPAFAVTIVASEPAASALRRAGEHLLPFALPDGRTHIETGEDPAPLLAAARTVIDTHRPDVALVSSSSLGAGVDEALLAVAPVPTFAMQDFWGDANLALGVPAQRYLVFDEEAAELTVRRFGVRALVVGSPKHARYGRLDVAQLRRDGRALACAESDRPIVGFFAQSRRIPGHDETFATLLDVLRSLDPAPLLLVRGHPKFVEEARGLVKRAQASGTSAYDATTSGEAEMWLAGCDVVTTVFSTCGLDHTYLAAHAPAPIGTLLYLLCAASARGFFETSAGLTTIPGVERGRGTMVNRPEDLASALASALGPEARRAYWIAAQAVRAADPCAAVRAAIAHSVGMTS
jgi:hypothetical protein